MLGKDTTMTNEDFSKSLLEYYKKSFLSISKYACMHMCTCTLTNTSEFQLFVHIILFTSFL